jgi:hypothetical protein
MTNRRDGEPFVLGLSHDEHPFLPTRGRP